VTAPERTVVVAGGGIGGAALAGALGRAGMAVTIVERTAAVRDAGAGLVIYPNALHALTSIDPDLATAVQAAGHVPAPDESRPIVAADGAVVHVDRVGELAERFGAPQVSLLRTALRSTLLDFATDAGVRLRTGVSVVDHVDRGAEVDVLLSDDTTITADALIGADGLYSAVRRRLLGDEPTRYCGYTTLRGRAPTPAQYPSGFIMTADGLGVFAAPIDARRLYWTAKVAAPAAVWPAKPWAGALHDLLALMSGWPRPIVDVVRHSDPDAPVVVTDINDREPVADISRGRVGLVGDAAHPMSPGAGQGAGMALEDAAVLADLLASTADVGQALRRYAARRAARTAAVVRQSRQRDHVVHGGRAEFSTHDLDLVDLLGWRLERSPST
jgi:2-polyprenyl-6-methoxyphenol hydroxylase-like FAD-dependent oxidoreductase